MGQRLLNPACGRLDPAGYDRGMDINVMVLNVGNSRLAVGAFVGGQLERVSRVPLDDRSGWAAAVAEAWRAVSDDGNGDAAVAGACVNPPLLEAVEQSVSQAADGRAVQWVGRDLDLPIPVKTDEPAATGVDRVLNVAAAYEQIGHACAVVDAGTALTVDCCDDAGAFLGGAIAPGAGLMLRALHEHTAKLPEVALAPPAGAYGRNTRDAMLHGVFTGVRGMVKELVESYATDLGRWPELVATGGDAETLFGGWELTHAVAPDLTLYGVALAYANHHIKHGT